MSQSYGPINTVDARRTGAFAAQAARYTVALVVALQRLLAAALQEPRNQRFVLLSESCASAPALARPTRHSLDRRAHPALQGRLKIDIAARCAASSQCAVPIMGRFVHRLLPPFPCFPMPSAFDIHYRRATCGSSRLASAQPSRINNAESQGRTPCVSRHAFSRRYVQRVHQEPCCSEIPWCRCRFHDPCR